MKTKTISAVIKDNPFRTAVTFMILAFTAVPLELTTVISRLQAAAMFVTIFGIGMFFMCKSMETVEHDDNRPR